MEEKSGDFEGEGEEEGKMDDNEKNCSIDSVTKLINVLIYLQRCRNNSGPGGRKNTLSRGVSASEIPNDRGGAPPRQSSESKLDLNLDYVDSDEEENGTGEMKGRQDEWAPKKVLFIFDDFEKVSDCVTIRDFQQLVHGVL